MQVAAHLSELNVPSTDMKNQSAQGAGPAWLQLLARQPLLIQVAVAHLALVPFALLFLLLDPRLIAGESPWIKP